MIESVPIAGNPAALIKSHHNVGGLPKNMKFQLVEPLKCLFKDEVRQLGARTRAAKGNCLSPALSRAQAWRCAFWAKSRRAACEILRNADAIVVEEMKASGWYYKIWQSFAVLLPVRSVGVMGDERTYDYTIALRAVESQDGMTADWVKLPYELLEKISTRIINEVKGVNRVCFDITSKPPGDDRVGVDRKAASSIAGFVPFPRTTPNCGECRLSAGSSAGLSKPVTPVTEEARRLRRRLYRSLCRAFVR